MSACEVSAALLTALRERAGAIPAERIDQVWLFPTRQVGSAESSLAVLSLFAAQDAAGRREILTLHCMHDPQKPRASLEIQLVEQGSAPVERLDRLIQGVLRRLGDVPEMPLNVHIGGSAELWDSLLVGAAPAA